MEAFRYHIYVCDQQKPEGVPSCSARGSGQMLEALRREIARSGLMDKVQITVCGCLDLCGRGPNMIVYPEGVWYSCPEPGDVAEIVRSHLQEGQLVGRLANMDEVAISAEIRTHREKVMAGLRARDASGAVPEDLTQAIQAFQQSRAILTALELDVFTAVGQGSTAAEAAAKLHTDPRATEMLLNTLVALNLLAKRDKVFQDMPASARYFAAGSPDDARAGLMHIAHLWRRWSNLTECVRRGTAVDGQEAGDRGEEWTRAFIAAMDRNARERAAQVVRALGTDGVKRMLDVGGGSGAYAIAFARANETLHADVLDTTAVVPIAQAHIDKAGLAQRVKTRVGDLRKDKLGEGYDLVLLSAICHMLSSEQNRDLLRRCHDALAPGGRAVIQDFLLKPDKTGPKTAALFSLNMLVGTKSGASYSEDEYAAWLREAGFQDVQRMFLPGPTGLMVASR